MAEAKMDVMNYATSDKCIEKYHYDVMEEEKIIFHSRILILQLTTNNSHSAIDYQ